MDTVRNCHTDVTLPSKARASLGAAKANVECYINCNVPELDRVECEEPLWLESYGEDDEVVPDSDTAAT